MAKMKEKGNIVTLGERTTIYATAKSNSRKVGEEFEAHPLTAKKLIKSGKATEKPPKNKEQDAD
jgi:hypothetical protein